MVNRPKADIDTNLGALLVNNTNGDIEADELLQQFRDMLDSYPNINGLSAGRVPLVSSVDGVAGASSIRETTDQLMFDKSAMIPGGSLDIESLRISNAGRQMLATDLVNNQMYDFASRPFDENTGSSNPTIDNRIASTTVAFQDRTNDTLNNSVLEATFVNATTATIYEWNSSVFASASGNFYIQIYEGSDATGDIYWQSHDQSQIDAGNVFTLNGGNTIHDCRVIPARQVDVPRRSHPLNLFANQMYFARFVAVGANFNVQGTTITQADVDNPNNIFAVVGQEVPYFQTRFQAFTQDRIVLDTDITDFGSGQVITTAERNKLAGITGIFRGNYSTTATYAHGDIVRSNYQGRPAMFISAAAQLPDTTLPEAKLDTGFWFLVTDRTWRGAWVASDYVAGQMVTHGGELWVALTIIGVGDTNPPSGTNTSWQQVSIDGSGTTMLPTIYRRSSTTIDAAFLSSRVDYDGSTGDATFTAPTTAATGFANGSTTYIENTSASNTLTLAAAAGVTIDGPTSVTAGQLVLLVWEAVSGSNDILHVYHINAAGGSGGGSAPTVQFARQNTTIPSTVADNTIYVVQPNAPDAGTLITMTLPDVGASPDVKRITIANDRPNVNGNVQVNLASGDTISNLFGEIDIMPGDAWQFVSTEENRWIVAARGEIPLFPSFPANPFNGDSTRFQFQRNGDTSTAWTEDRNTSIDLNRASGSIQAYEIANPSTSGITVNDGDGYIFRNVNSVSWQIFPFSSANTMIVDGSTITSASPLVLQTNTSLVLLYDAGQSRWEGQVFNSLLPQASPGAGGASMANSSSLPDSGKWFARNEDVVALDDAEGVSLIARDGYVGMIKAGLGTDKFLEGFTIGDTPINESSQIVYHGPVRTTTIYTGLNLIGNPLSASTSVTPSNLYWDEQLARVRTDDESGAHFKVGEVLSSGWILGTVATPFTSNQTIDTQAEWDAWVGEVQTKDYASAGEVQIPDLAEGSSEVTAVAGTQFILRVPFGQGTMVIRPRGASTIAPKSGSGTTYDNTTPLPMTGGASDEFVIIEVNESANGYYHYPINQDGIVSQFFFDASDYERRVREGQAYDMSVLIQANTTNMSLLRSYTRIPNLVDGIANPAGYSVTNQKNGVTYFTSGGSVDADRVWTINTTASGWTDFQSNRTVEIMFLNEKATTTALVKLSSGNFFGTASDTITIPGGEHRRILITNTGSATLQGRDVT